MLNSDNPGAMLNRKGREHPFYWASFIQVGEWVNLEEKREPPNTFPGRVRRTADPSASLVMTKETAVLP